MSPSALAWYLGGAALLALLSGGAVLALLRLFGQRPGRAALALLFLTLFFVFLAMHPFPDPATLDCTRGGKAARLHPFAFMDRIGRLIRRGSGPLAWAGDLTVAAAAMNFLLCAAIGFPLAGVTRRWLVALLFGAGLTLAIEFTQLTGIWGLYPCPYRQFDVDDLILNLAGILAGFALGRLWNRGPPVDRPEGGPDSRP